MGIIVSEQSLSKHTKRHKKAVANNKGGKELAGRRPEKRGALGSQRGSGPEGLSPRGLRQPL